MSTVRELVTLQDVLKGEREFIMGTERSTKQLLGCLRRLAVLEMKCFSHNFTDLAYSTQSLISEVEEMIIARTERA